MNPEPEEFTKGYSTGLPVEFTPEWFDYSSKMWLQNKRKRGQSYEYVCKKEKCKNKPYLQTEWCKWHHPQLQKGMRVTEKN